MGMIQKVESQGAIAAWRISMALMTLVMSALLALILASLNHTSTMSEINRETNVKQDQAIILLQAQTEALQRSSDAAVISLHAITLQMTRDDDRLNELEHIKKARR